MLAAERSLFHRRLTVSTLVSMFPPASVIKHTKLEGSSLQELYGPGLYLNSHSLGVFGGVGVTCDTTASGGGLDLAGSSSGSALSLRLRVVLVDGPVEDVIVLEALTDEEVTEDLAQVAVVGLVVETQRTSVVQVDGKLVGEASAQDLGGSSHLLLHDAVVLLLLGGSLQTLPGQGATAEVEHDITQRLHVITTGLLCHIWISISSQNRVQHKDLLHTDTQVSIDGGVTGGTSQVLVLSVGNVEVRLGVAVLLSQTEIDDIDLVATLADAHQEVVGLDITVDKGFGVNVLDARDELIRQQEDSLERELAVAKVEQILKTGAEKVQNHSIVVALSSEPTDKGNTDTTGERLVHASLIFELRVLGFDTLKLDSDLLAGNDVGAEVNVTERARADLAANTVFVTDT